jgi:hypothetical protein
VLFVGDQVIEVFDQLDEFGVVCLYLNLAHKLVHPHALLRIHCSDASRELRNCLSESNPILQLGVRFSVCTAYALVSRRES